MKNKNAFVLMSVTLVFVLCGLQVFATPTPRKKVNFDSAFVKFPKQEFFNNDASFNAGLETLSNSLFERNPTRTDQAEFVALTGTEKKENFLNVWNTAKDPDWCFRENLSPFVHFRIDHTTSAHSAQTQRSILPDFEDNPQKIPMTVERKAMLGENLCYKHGAATYFQASSYVTVFPSSCPAPPIPEPATLHLMLVGLLVFFCIVQCFNVVSRRNHNKKIA